MIIKHISLVINTPNPNGVQVQKFLEDNNLKLNTKYQAYTLNHDCQIVACEGEIIRAYMVGIEYSGRGEYQMNVYINGQYSPKYWFALDRSVVEELQKENIKSHIGVLENALIKLKSV